MPEAVVPMLRGNALKKVPAKEVAVHEKHSWKKFEDGSAADQAKWRSRQHLLDPSVRALIIEPKPATKVDLPSLAKK